MTSDLRRLYARANANLGIVSILDVDALGIARDTFYDHVDATGWVRRHRGVWTAPGAGWTVQHQALAALRAVGPPALVTGESGLSLFEVTQARPSCIDLLVPPNRSGGGHKGVRVKRTQQYEQIASGEVRGVAVACVERCLIDAAPALAIDPLIRRMAAAVRLRLSDLAAMEEAIAALRRYPGRAKLLAALSALNGELVHSNPEQVARDALRPMQLGFHHEPYTVWDGSRRVAEIDIPHLRLLYGVEVDGPHHELPEQQRKDEARDRELRDLGWRIDRFRWDDVTENPRRFATTVARAVASRRREIGLPD